MIYFGRELLVLLCAKELRIKLTVFADDGLFTPSALIMAFVPGL